MRIILQVPYDEQRLRRTIKFVLRPSVKKLRLAGAVMAPLGVLLLLLGVGPLVPLLLIGLGLLYAFALEPFMVRQSLRAQNPVVRQGYQLVVDDAGFTMEAEAYAQRMAWSTVQRVEEQPDAWFLVISKVQALAVHKHLMTEEQRAEFAALLAQRVRP
ncbi:YcxB family protein [Saccharothrix sp. 6-C]|uniref:YcxB family protein n=1 Tax=Saccharothrix sp. 6-C TaxID=2781735 RepID=UPI001917812C|nr:YcxB family protein [Saccharothrix sp. 6-C]QQQ78287.1 YcxB family protein [Saccharothrix sp. 6-C]